MKNLKTHMAWTIFILSALLIGSLSVSWSTLREIPNIVSIALGLSSLVLAMVAIVQTLTGTGTLLQSLSKIETAADRALEATNAVKDAAKSLTEKAEIVDGIPTALGNIHSRMDQIASANSSSSSTSNTQVEENQSHNKAHRIYADGTKGFNIAMYIALKSFKSNLDFESSDIFPADSYISGQITAFIVSMMMCGNIKMNYIQGRILVRSLGIFDEDLILEMMDESMKAPDLAGMRVEIDNYFRAAGSNGEGDDENPSV